MTNHVHLLMQSLETHRGITKAMHGIRFGAHETRATPMHAHFEAYSKPRGKVIENTYAEITKDK